MTEWYTGKRVSGPGVGAFGQRPLSELKHRLSQLSSNFVQSNESLLRHV